MVEGGASGTRRRIGQRRAAILGAAFLLSGAGPAWGQADTAEAEAPIGRIRVVNHDVFDPRLDPRFASFPYPLLNRLHVRTRPRVIEREVLLRPGQPYSSSLAAESERHLRSYSFLGRVSIRPVRRPRASGGDTIDLVVTTEDQWTTNADVVLDQRGNLGRLGMGLEEENVLGLGKYFNLRFETSTDRDLWRTIYRDPRLLGSRWALRVRHVEASNGHQTRIAVERPLYSLSSRWSLKGEYLRETGIERLYDAGRLAAAGTAVRHRVAVTAMRAWRRGAYQHLVTAAAAGRQLAFPEPFDLYRPTASAAVELARAGLQARDDAGVEVGWEARKVRYIRRRFIDRAGLVEDIRVGPAGEARVGWWKGKRGAGGDYGTGGLRGTAVLAPGPRWLTVLDAEAATQRRRSGWVNAQLSAFIHQYWQPMHWQTVALGLAYHQTWHMDQPDQLVLGEDVGLRGYPARQFTGDRLVLANLEDRLFTPLEVGTSRLGFAPFADAGMAWHRGQPLRLRELRASAGVSVRLAIAKFSDGPVLRLDVAFPLRRGEAVGRYSVGLSFSPVFRSVRGPEDRVRKF